MKCRLQAVFFLAALLAVASIACSEDGEPDPAPTPEPVTTIGDTGAPDAADPVADTPPPEELPAPDGGSKPVADDGSTDTEVEEPDTGVVAPPPDLAEMLGPEQSRAGVIAKTADLIGGLKADGRVGDIKIYNSRVAFVIEGVRKADGYRVWGGNVVDADVVRPPEEPGRDLFGELFHTWNLNLFEPDAVEIVSDGSEGPAHVRVTGKNGVMAFAEAFVRPIFDAPTVELSITLDYILEPDATGLIHRVTVKNLDSQSADVDLPALFNSQGDGMRQWLETKGFASPEGEVGPIRLSSRDLAYALVPKTDFELTNLFDYNNVFLTIEDGYAVEAGETATREYVLAVTDNGPAGLDAALSTFGLADTSAGVLGTVTVPETAAWREAYVALWDGSTPISLAPVREDGSFELAAAPGTYQLQAYARHHAASPSVEVVLAAGDTVEPALEIPAAGRVEAKVTDSAGGPVSARVVLRATGGTPSPYPPSSVRIAVKGEWSWTSTGGGGKMSAIGYAVGGEVSLIAPAGEYTATATRGFTYEVDEAPLTLVAGEITPVALMIDRTVDTTGWVSGDFHIHAQKSPDSAVPYEVRVRQAITDDLDVPVLTEHVMASSFQPTADALGVGDEIAAVAGQEVTTFVYGHFNAFPLLWDPEKVNGGAIFPHDKDPIALFEAIRAQHEGDEIIQVNHPRGVEMGSYFSYAGFDPKDGSVQKPEGWSTGWDAIEVFNGRCGGSENAEALKDYVAMTNLGMRPTLSSGSDSHNERSPIGFPRNWIHLDMATLQADHQSLVPAVRGRRMVVSCGPFVTFETADGSKGLGDLVAVDESGKIELRAQVQAPGWMAVTELRLLRNGEPIDIVPIAETAPGLRLDALLADTPTEDAWYAVEVVGEGSLLPVYAGGPPYALTNAIEVDADGDGEWTAPAK